MKKKVLTVLCAAMVAASCLAAGTGTASAAHKHSYSCTVIRPVLCDVTATLFDTVKFINIIEEQLDGQDLDIVVDTMGIQTADLGTENPEEIYNIILNQQDAPQ